MSTIFVSDVVAGISDACDIEIFAAQEKLDALIGDGLTWLEETT